jgi:hypothetical protein
MEKKYKDISEDALHASGESPEIEERLLNDGHRSPESLESVADDAFVADQRDPDHPSRKQRELEREQGVENPSHSQGI